MGCNRPEHIETIKRQFIEFRSLGVVETGEIYYELHEVGEYQFEYSFLLVQGIDTMSLFKSSINVYFHEMVNWFIVEKPNIVQIKSNRPIGWRMISLGGTFYELTEKHHPREGLSLTIYGGSEIITQNMYYSDSLRGGLSDKERAVHDKVWQMEEVVKKSKSLGDEDDKIFTMITKYPSDTTDYYEVQFGEIMQESLKTISSFRVSLPLLSVERIDTMEIHDKGTIQTKSHR